MLPSITISQCCSVLLGLVQYYTVNTQYINKVLPTITHTPFPQTDKIASTEEIPTWDFQDKVSQNPIELDAKKVKGGLQISD